MAQSLSNVSPPLGAVSEADTVMYYKNPGGAASMPDTGPAYYRNDSFQPVFLEDVDAATMAAAEAFCGESVACLFDYVASGGDEDVAGSSNSFNKNADHLEVVAGKSLNV